MEASVRLTTVARMVMLGGVLLAMICLAGSARSQGADATQAKCAAHAQRSWPDDFRYREYQRPRQQAYINCMMEHGQRP